MQKQNEIVKMMKFHNSIKMKLYRIAIYEYIAPNFWLTDLNHSYHNDWKTTELKQQSSLNIVDLCTGKGGDIWKWEKFNPVINKIYAFDINNEYISEAKSRLATSSITSFKKKTSFIGDTDLTQFTGFKKLNDTIISISGRIHLISIQMAIHYFWETEDIFDRLIEWISNSLLPGGLFIGTFVCAEHVINYFKKVQRQREKQKQRGERVEAKGDCDNDESKIYFADNQGFMQINKKYLNDENDKSFGHPFQMQISKSIIDTVSKEYLVYAETFKDKMIKKFDFDLVQIKTFNDFNNFDNLNDDSNDFFKHHDNFSTFHSIFIFQKRNNKNKTN